MVQKRTVEDIMVPIEDYEKISDDTTVYQAIKILQATFHRDGKAWHGHRSVVVLDHEGQLTGILTLRGLLKAAGLQELVDDINIKADSWGWYYMNRIREESRMRVRDVMRPINVATVNAQDNVYDVAMSLLKHQVNSLPVMKDGKLIGLVRTLDIFTVIHDYFKV